MKAGLRKVPKFEELLGNGLTYDLDERVRVYGRSAKNYREGFFHTPAIELLDEDHDSKHEAVLAALQGIKASLDQRPTHAATQIGFDKDFLRMP